MYNILYEFEKRVIFWTSLGTPDFICFFMNSYKDEFIVHMNLYACMKFLQDTFWQP